MLTTNRPGTSRKLLVWTMVAVAVGLLAVTSLTDPSGAGSLFVGLLLIPGIIGGAIALAILLFRGRPAESRRPTTDSFAGDTSHDVINMARIRVAGVGGLGMIVVAVAMGIVLTRVGETLMLGVVGGVLVAGLVILYRRRSGPLSMKGPGGRAYLVDDEEEITPVARIEDDTTRHAREAATPIRA